MRDAKFRRMDEGKKRRKKTYRQEKEAKEAHLLPAKKNLTVFAIPFICR